MGFCSQGGLISVAQVYHDFMMKERKGEGETERKRGTGILLLIRGESLHYNFEIF